MTTKKNLKDEPLIDNETKNNTTFYKIEQKHRVGRPVSKNSGFNVTVHKTSKYKYLSIQRKKNVNGKIIFCHYHIGGLNENNEFIPSKNYIFSPKEFKEKLVFPKEVKMNVLENLEDIIVKNTLKQKTTAKQKEPVPVE